METEKRRGRGANPVSPIIKTSVKPELGMVAAQVEADKPCFVPKLQDSVYFLKAQNGATLPHRATAVIDCGVDIKLSPGWKLVVNSIPKWTEKGLLSSPNIITEGRVKVCVTNVGKEIIVINPEDNIAQITVEPLYLMDWTL